MFPPKISHTSAIIIQSPTVQFDNGNKEYMPLKMLVKCENSTILQAKEPWNHNQMTGYT